jgi:hypothetical protein
MRPHARAAVEHMPVAAKAAADRYRSGAEYENFDRSGKSRVRALCAKHPFLLVQNVPTGSSKTAQIVENPCNETMRL